MVRLTVSAFSDEYAPDLEGQIAGMKKLGLTYMEPRMIDGKNIADFSEEEAIALRKRLEEAGIRVRAVGSPIGKLRPEEDFDAHLKRAENAFHVANILGAAYCRVFSFYGLPEKEVFARMEKLLWRADAAGIILCHENEAKIYGESPDSCLRLLEHFKGRLEAVFDMGNFVLGGYDPLAAYALLKPYIAYFHIKDASRGVILPAGEGDAKIKEILAHHGDALVSLEPHLFDHAFIRGLSPEQLTRIHSYESPAEAFTAGANAFFSLMQ